MAPMMAEGKDSTGMNNVHIDELLERLQSGELSRRSFMRRATAMGMTAGMASMLARRAGAQDASPEASPVAAGEQSITRQEFQAQLMDAFEMEEPQQTGGTVIHVNTSDIRTLHPHLYTDTYSGYIATSVYEFLATGSPIDGTPVPALADYWEVADDGVTYTFHIAENAMWHDGNPVTADDVVFSFDSMLDENTLSVRRSGVLLALESYEKVDDKTVQLVSKGPMATFVADTAGTVAIIPKHLWEDLPVDEWGSDPGATGQDPSRVIGSGPFRFVEWVLGDHATIERNPDYWDSEHTPVIDQFIYRVVADPASATASLQTGEADIVEVPFAQANQLREQYPDLIIEDYDTLSFNYFYTNQDEARGTPFTEVPVRQALMYALDRDLISDTVYEGFAIRAIGTQPVLSIAYNPDRINTDYVFDPEMAASLLDEAGWAVGDDGIRAKDGERLSFECIYSEGAATYETQIPYMQQAWREVGIEMLPAAIPFPTLIEQVISGNFDMAVAGFSWGVDGSQGDMFRCDATPPNGFNRMRYCNEQYDELDEQQRAELDVDRRIDLLIEQSNIVNDEAAAGILVFRKDIMGSNPRVRNFIPNGYSTFWTLRYMWVEE
jgi:peptide/nickel transport system substrate-binding protein